MRTVYKYPLLLESEQRVSMPAGAELLDVQAQPLSTPTMVGQIIMLWARIDTDQPKVDRLIHISGTGHFAPEDAPHVGTVQISAYVWHVFDGGQV